MRDNSVALGGEDARSRVPGSRSKRGRGRGGGGRGSRKRRRVTEDSFEGSDAEESESDEEVEEEEEEYSGVKAYRRDPMVYAFHTLYSFFNYRGRYNQPSYQMSGKEVQVKQRDIAACGEVLKDVFGFELRRVPHRTSFYIYNCLFDGGSSPTWALAEAQQQLSPHGLQPTISLTENLLLVRVLVILFYSSGHQGYSCEESVLREELGKAGMTLTDAQLAHSIEDLVRQGYLDSRMDNDRKNVTFGPRVFTKRDLTEEEKQMHVDPRFDQELSVAELMALTGSGPEDPGD